MMAQSDKFLFLQANSFQQLNMMGFGGPMMWGAPCDVCQPQQPPVGYPNSVNSSANGMKRTGSNLSMNLSTVGSDISSGYPWAPPHVHHHMPFYPGYYPPPPPGVHHVAPGMSMQGSAMSIPDSMQTFNKIPPSPAPSVRSSSHRSHKSSKSRSFNSSETKSRRTRNKSRRRSEESDESRTSSESDGDDNHDEKTSKSGYQGGLAWQCDHCTFINPGSTRTCGMCSKSTGLNSSSHSRKGSDRRRSRRDRRTDHEDEEQNLSDYDNDSVLKSNLSFNIKDSKRENRTKVSSSNKSSSKGKKKSRRRDSSAESASPSITDIEDEERKLEQQLRELRMTARSRQGGDYESAHGRSRDKDRSSRKREGKRT